MVTRDYRVFRLNDCVLPMVRLVDPQPYVYSTVEYHHFALNEKHLLTQTNFFL
ncbi:hypothetical protein HanIR_Chr01g0039521 [Helianthus annuus]|nr:hypothetical protein HanIR_Chr01g0039521 [Helianthus annuus]